MKKLIFSLFTIVCTLNSFGQESCNINNDGVYVASIDKEHNAYLRFFGSDSVITTTSDMPKNLSREHIIKEYKEFVMQGTYKIKGCFIRMKVEGFMGKAKLEGYILEESIGLSKINLQNNTYTNLIFFLEE